MISAAAIKCIGGQLLGRLWPRNDDERQAAVDGRLRPRPSAERDDLVAGEDVFFSATGVTDGDVLQGVRYQGDRGRDDRVAGDALTLGHGAAGLGAPRPREAARADRRRATADRRSSGVAPALAGGAGASGWRVVRLGDGQAPDLRLARGRASPASAGSACVTSTWIEDCVAS